MRTPKSILSFILMLIVIVLVNIASTTLFVRSDLTKNRIYSLSEASKTTVSELKEPLTIKIFFSPNLPAPYNNTEQILRDLLEEYAIAGSRFFNYDFITVPARSQSGETSPEEDEARRYRIFPIQIQNVQQDEVQLVTATMGVAILHGDMLETIPAITTTANLEYQITGLIDNMSDKISALLSMRESIEVRLFLTKNLESISSALISLPAELEAAVAELNLEYYGRLNFDYVDPALDGSVDVEGRYGAVPLVLRNQDGTEERAFATLVISRGDRSTTVEIISRGIFGLQIADSVSLGERIGAVADSLIGVQQEIGYVTGNGSPSLQGPIQEQSPIVPVTTDLSGFTALVSSEYQWREIDLDTETIPEGLETIVIVSPRERLSDYALFQLDQFLLRGNNLLLFPDSHVIYMPQGNQFGSSQDPIYLPRNTGLEDLIRHYGLELEQGYVMDEKSFVQRQRSAQGGIVESTVYFAPIIDGEGRNTDLDFLKAMPDMVALNISPVRPTESGADGAVPLLTSSIDGWVVSGDAINLATPFMIQPPPDESQERVPMAYMRTASFMSYYAGSPVPRPPSPEDDNAASGAPGVSTGAEEEGTNDAAVRAAELDSSLELQGQRLNDGEGTLVVIGGSATIGSNLVDAEGANGNSMFVLNLFDYLSGREDYAIMRTKGASFNPLEETTPALRSFVKTFNIAGLPIIVVLIGIGIWLARNARKKSIEARFSSIRRGSEHE